MVVGKPLTMAVRMAIIPEISKQNYDTMAKQFREVVANAFDAKATEVSIKVRYVGVGAARKIELVFEDNGLGMTPAEFERDYLGIGDSPKADDPETIGRIGIGSLAVAVLCPSLRVETRKQGTDEILVADLWVGKAVRGAKKAEEVQSVQIGQIVDIRKPKPEDPPHFTRLTLHDVYPETAEILQDKGRFQRVVEELRRILPLRYPEDHPLLQKMQADLREILLDTSRLPTIEVLISAPCLGDGALRLERYAHGHFSQEEESIDGFPRPLAPMAVPGGVYSSLTIFGYLVDAGRQLHEGRRGLVVRVKNMGVELNCFFESNDAAANVRITGELFIENLDERYAMTINRNELVKDHPDYLAIRAVMQRELASFSKEVRGRVDINSRIKKEVSRAEGVRKALVQVGEAIGEIGIDIDLLSQEATVRSNAEDVDIEQEIRDLDDGILVWRLPTLEKSHNVKHVDDEIQVTLSADILDTVITVGAEEFKYCLKKGLPSDPPCEINAAEREIYINVGHPVLASRGDQIIRAVAALEFAYLQANGDAKRLYDLTLNILGTALH